MNTYTTRLALLVVLATATPLMLFADVPAYDLETGQSWLILVGGLAILALGFFLFMRNRKSK